MVPRIIKTSISSDRQSCFSHRYRPPSFGFCFIPTVFQTPTSPADPSLQCKKKTLQLSTIHCVPSSLFVLLRLSRKYNVIRKYKFWWNVFFLLNTLLCFSCSHSRLSLSQQYYIKQLLSQHIVYVSVYSYGCFLLWFNDYCIFLPFGFQKQYYCSSTIPVRAILIPPMPPTIQR